MPQYEFLWPVKKPKQKTKTKKYKKKKSRKKQKNIFNIHKSNSVPTCYTCGVQHIGCWQCGIGYTVRAYKRSCVQPCNWLRIFYGLLLLAQLCFRCFAPLTPLLHSHGVHAFLWAATHFHSHTHTHTAKRVCNAISSNLCAYKGVNISGVNNILAATMADTRAHTRPATM